MTKEVVTKDTRRLAQSTSTFYSTNKALMVAFMPDTILVAVFLFLIVINVYFKLFQDYHPFFDHAYKALIG